MSKKIIIALYVVSVIISFIFLVLSLPNAIAYINTSLNDYGGQVGLVVSLQAAFPLIFNVFISLIQIFFLISLVKYNKWEDSLLFRVFSLIFLLPTLLFLILYLNTAFSSIK